MENTISALVERFGSQGKAATTLGVTDRTFRNYVKNPERVPKPMRRLMESVLRGGEDTPPPVQPLADTEARA